MANVTTETFNKLEKSAQNLKDRVSTGEEQLTQMTYDAGKKVGAIASDFANSTMDYAKTGRDYVKENPAKGLAIAAGVGILAGSLLTIVMRRRH
jgi:ElaB/YqjD/DUF883 family membrane-anchored ribosome-binding protein